VLISLTGLGFYNDTIISVDFPATGNFVLTVAERSVSNVAGVTGCLDATPEDLNITVVAAPTVVYNNGGTYVMGGCGADIAANNNIPLTVAGCNTLQVTYRIDYTNLSGTTSALVATGTMMQDGDNADFTTGWGALSVSQGPSNIAIPFNITNGNYGTYTVTLEGVTDRIERKSLDAVASYGEIGLAGGIPGNDLTVGRQLKIYALPTPSTRPIRHITNLGW
jgi:hypothetical protein